MSLEKFSKLLPSTYHFLSAACFSIFNQPQAVPSIWIAAHKNLQSYPELGSKLSAESTEIPADVLLARQFRESLLRAGIFGGMSKAINVR